MISIIIPVYNNETTIENTLDSILYQECNDIEIVIVDDGSTDRSYQVCEKYAKRNSYIRLYHNNINLGVSVTRNKGLRYAQKKYIWFIDADDQIQLGCIRLILDELYISPTDMLIMNYQSKSRAEVTYTSKYELSNERMSSMNHEELRNYIYGINNVSWSVWSKIISRDILLDNNILFDEDLRTSEDADWSLLCIEYMKHVRFLDQVVYIYYLNENSLSHSGVSYLKYRCGQSVYVKWFDLLDGDIKSKDIEFRIAMSYCNINRMIPYLDEQDRRVALREYKNNIRLVNYCKDNPIKLGEIY